MTSPFPMSEITYRTLYTHRPADIRVDFADMVKVHRATKERLLGIEDRLIYGREAGQAIGYWRNMTPCLQQLERDAIAAWRSRKNDHG